MKTLQSLWMAASLLFAFAGSTATASVTAWDPQGSSGGQPVGGIWENAVWSTSQTGQSTPVNWIEGTSALFAVGSTSNTSAFTVTMNSSHTVAGIFDGSLTPGPCPVTISGTGSMILPAGLQPFNISGSVTIKVPVTGSNDLGKGGSGTLVLTASNSFGLTNTVVSNGWLVLANTSGSATGTSGINVQAGATLTGSGTTAGTVTNAGYLYPTNLSGGPATLTMSNLVWQSGASYPWAIQNASGTAGSGWDELVLNGSMTNRAAATNPLVINIISLLASNQAGALASFNNTRDQSWLVLHSTNGPMVGFSNGTVAVNSTLFSNALGANAGFNVTTDNTPTGEDIFVNFVHQPSLTLTNLTVVQGSNAVFNAINGVAGSTPYTAAYSWRSNGVLMSDGGQISGSTTASLTISNAQLNNAGTYFVTASNAGGQAFISATLTITEVPPVVTWSNPPPIVYGTALTTNQLNATANVPGTFVYTPALGMVPNAGTNTVTEVFTPSNSVQYTTVTNTVSLIVSNAPLTVTANSYTRPINTANPTFTATLAGLTNNDNITVNCICSAGTGSPAGAYPIVPVLVDPGNRQTNYNVTLINGALDVGSVINWTNPPPIQYGTGLTTNQLNATADVAGSFVYSPVLGTILPSIGTYALSVVFTPSNNGQYGNATNSVSVTVSPAPLTVTASNASRSFGTTNPSFNGTIVGVTNGDNIVASYSSTANASSPMGAYPIVPALVDPSNRQTNYTVSLVNGTLTVGAAPQGIAVNAPNIIPLPVTLQTKTGTFVLCPTQRTPTPAHALLKILFDRASQQTAQYLEAALYKSTGYQFQLAASTASNAVKGAILITTSNALSNLGAEGYELTVAPDSVVIRAPAQGGTFYGVQSLLQLLPPQIFSPTIVTNVVWAAPCVYVQDYPQYSWRGVMVDVARHFINKDQVKQIVDAMAMHKLNTLHLHLSDDQGWRLEINGYPELTATHTNGLAAGAWRNGIDYGLNPRASTAFDPATGQYGGFYTQADAREIVAYAMERHITLVPEMEIPLHTSCVLAADPQFSCGHPASSYPIDYPTPGINYNADVYSPGTPATMTFFTNTLSQMMDIFPGQYIHCGGDELISLGSTFTSPENDNDWNTYPADTSNMIANGITPGVYQNNGLLPEFTSCAQLAANTPAYPGANKCCGDISIVQYQHWLSTTLSEFIHGYGRTMIGWTEYEFGGLVPNAAIEDWEPVGSGSFAAQAAQSGLPAVVGPGSYCYFNYVEGTGSSSLSVEPPFVVGGTASYLPLSTVYSFNPMPCGLTAPAANNILGAECILFTEYVPSFRNMMFKLFPRSTAMSEVLWTPAASHNYASFTNRLVTQDQRFAAAGINYDHETVPQIGTWGPTVAQSPATQTLIFDVTTNVTAAGEVDVNFWYTSGANGLNISSVALYVNNTQVDIDTHAGNAAKSSTYSGTAPFIPVYTLYVLHLPQWVPGAIYTVKAVVSGDTGPNTSGTVYMPNWN